MSSSDPDPQGASAAREVARQLEMLAAVARRTGNAVIATDDQGRIEWVNEGFTRLTEFQPEEALGRRPGELLQGPDTSTETRSEMAQAIRARQPFDVVVLNYARSGRQYWVRVEAEPTRDANGAITGYIAMETDVTERRIAEGRERVLKQIGDRLLTCGSIEESAGVVVNELVQALDVRASQVWTVEPGVEELRYVTGASATSEGQVWLDASSTRPFRKGTEWVVGVGAPGSAWGTGRCCVKTDFWEQDSRGQYSRRAQAARQTGIRTVCAVPVFGPDGVVAVIEIGGSHTYPGHEQLPSLVERVAQQLGAFIVQHQSRRAFEVLFRQSPDALLVVDGAGRVTGANARARALFGEAEGKNLSTLIEEGSTLLAVGRDGALHTRTGHRPGGSSFIAEVSVSSTDATEAHGNIVAVRDLTERHLAEERLRQSLEEKVTLVQEVHHRVKNNLQIISSLVSMQADGVTDKLVRSALTDTVNRIHSMALVHQQLYASDNLARIEFGDYARALCSTLRSSLAPDAEMTFETTPVEIPVEQAAPAGLILNEVLTNAFKHGRDAEGRCRVSIGVGPLDTGVWFSVADEGPGLPEGPARRGSMGATLIKALVRQLRARHTTSPTILGEGIGRGALQRFEIPPAD